MRHYSHIFRKLISRQAFNNYAEKEKLAMVKKKAEAFKQYRQSTDEKDRRRYARIRNDIKWEVRKVTMEF